MLRLVVLIFLVLGSCQSKPVRVGGLLPVDGKATVGPVGGNFVEIGVVTAYAPRRAQELESAFLLNLEVQECLRGFFKEAGEGTSIGIEGYLNNQGAVNDLAVDLTSAESKGCFEKSAKLIELGRGRSGPFKMRILRAPIAGQKVKTFLLELDEVKKLEKVGLPLDLRGRRL